MLFNVYLKFFRIINFVFMLFSYISSTNIFEVILSECKKIVGVF